MTPLFARSLKERQYLKKRLNDTIQRHERGPPKRIRTFVLRMRGAGLKARSANCRSRSVNAYLRWTNSPLRVPKLKEEFYVP
jgi:hypothetical protein